VFEHRALRGAHLSVRGRKWHEYGENCILRSFIRYKKVKLSL
jgi:hypothetical protein